MDYTLYTGNDCHQCKEVIDFLRAKNISFEEVNIDEKNNKPPVELFIFPALFKENILIAYGVDIILKFKNQ